MQEEKNDPSHSNQIPQDPEEAAAIFWRRFWACVTNPQIATAITAIATAVLAVTTLICSILLWNANKQAANAAASAADTAAKTLVISQRPWLSITRLSAEGPFKFGKDGASVGIRFVVHNNGNTPALNYELIPEIKPLVGLLDGPVQEAKRFCDPFVAKRSLVEPFGTIFPNTDQEERQSLDLGQNDIAKGSHTFSNGKTSLPLALIVCVVYQSSVDADNSQWHLTREIYSVIRSPQNVLSPGNDVPADELLFDKSLWPEIAY